MVKLKDPKYSTQNDILNILEKNTLGAICFFQNALYEKPQLAITNMIGQTY